MTECFAKKIKKTRKKVLTKAVRGGIIDKLSRKTNAAAKRKIGYSEKCSCYRQLEPDQNFGKAAVESGRKKSQKGLDKEIWMR